MLFCVVLRYAQPKMHALQKFEAMSSKMLAFDGCLVQAMDCTFVHKCLRCKKMYVCILPVQGSHPCLHKAIMCMPAQGNQTTIQCLNKALTICFFEMGGDSA